jgi:hypothetical protein
VPGIRLFLIGVRRSKKAQDYFEPGALRCAGSKILRTTRRNDHGEDSPIISIDLFACALMRSGVMVSQPGRQKASLSRCLTRPMTRYSDLLKPRLLASGFERCSH